jgi:antitoxin component HigA of HigAB toxin-antitoxin module
MDNDLNIGSLDNERINIHEYYEVEHWTKELHTNVEALKRAVENVGPSIEDIKQYLNK